MKKLTEIEILEKLNALYNKEEHLKKLIITIKKEYEQLQEDKELLQQVYMHQSNKLYRFNKK